MRPSRRLHLVALLIATMTTPAAALEPDAQRVVIMLKPDGPKLEGLWVDSTVESVTIQIAGFNRTILRSEIARLEFRKSVKQEYDQRRKALEDKDIGGRYELAYWLVEQNKYQLALSELDQLALQFPDEERVKALRGLVSHKLKTTKPADPVETTPDVAAEKNARNLRGLPRNRLTAEQINKIKIMEIDPAKNPNVIIPRQTIATILSRYEDDEFEDDRKRKRFYDRPGHEILAKMFELEMAYPEIRSLYKDVKIRSDPASIRTFRTQVHRPYVISYCATSRCHGGPHAGKLFLFATRAGRDETAYTNFYILDSYRAAKQAEQKFDMIDRHDPGKSLLIQYGRHRDETTTPHPDVPGWRPHAQLRSGGRNRLRDTLVNWIDQLNRDTTNYEIDYDIPDLSKKPTPKPPAPTKKEEPVKTGGDVNPATRGELNQ